MRRRTQGEKDAMLDAAMDAKYEQAERASKGLCVACGNRPDNPATPGHTCLDCHTDSKGAPFNCSKAGCPNPPAGNWMQQPLCEAHLIDRAHKNYEEYLKLKSEINELGKKKERLQDVIPSPKDSFRKRNSEISDEEQEYQEVIFKLRDKNHEFQRLKKNMRRAKESVDELFPENFDSSI